MNTNPNAKRILCYGDSNTHGRDAKKKAELGIKVRYPADVRWTGQLQNMLGNEYEVIEEGLGGRTTDLDYQNSNEKNGIVYLPGCLSSHAPLDVVILMLGTNDLKEEYNRSANDIAEANRRLIKIIKTKSPEAKIFLVSPVFIDENNPMIADKYKGATEKSKQLAQAFEKIATEEGTGFIDLAKHATYSQYDGVNIDPEEQAKIAKVMAEEVRSIL